MSRDRRQGGLIKVLGAGVGMAAEYREHRKQQKLSRENSLQSISEPVAGPSSRPEVGARGMSSTSALPPPAYEDVIHEADSRSFASGAPASDDKKGALRQYDDDDDDSDSDFDSLEPPQYAELEGDEAVWDLDEAFDRERGTTTPPESPVEPSKSTNQLINEVLSLNRAALASAPGFRCSPLPCSVILPQRRPRTKTRGFVHAYAPLLGECSGISQTTFLTFLKNFHTASQASPIFPIIKVSAMIAGFAPSVIAMAVTTAVQIGASIGQEIQERQRTNNFLDTMNEELFKPAGLYCMIVKYKSEEEVLASGNSPLARLGISGDKVDLSTNQTIAKYTQTSPSGAEQRTMGQRMQNLRLASGTTKGSFQLPESAPLIFPEIDNAVAVEGEATFKAKAKDAQGFLADYFDRKAHVKYAQADPNSALIIPEEQRAFRSKLADPNHPMYNGGLIGFVSGGTLTRERGMQQLGQYDRQDSRRQDSRRMDRGDRKDDRRERKHERKDDRRLDKYERRLDHGRGLSSKKERRYEDIMARRGGPGLGAGNRPNGPIGMLIGAAAGAIGGRGDDGRSRGYEDGYGGRAGPYDGRGTGRSFDDRDPGYGRSSPHAPYGGQSSGFENSYGRDPYAGQGSNFNGYGQAAQYGQPAPYGHQSQTNGVPFYSGDSVPAPYSHGGNRGGRDNGRRNRQKQDGPIKKMMTEDVLYLMIVNLPSEAELAEARETLARARGN
ncbi:hypothetical protein LTR09_000999 [Extremus antarcticus]|uniref:Uncharacterized protein n=1 Tax=Extremus antarcticus TaxID=702011 RepID=A0AAJ0LWL3_9PEZI|nr:hypothetical protein LTR09_000999 [Extremus antarcticus]